MTYKVIYNSICNNFIENRPFKNLNNLRVFSFIYSLLYKGTKTTASPKLCFT